MAHEAFPTQPWFKYAVNGLGLALMALNSAEVMTFIPASIIVYLLAGSNLILQFLTKGPESFIAPKS